MTGTERHEVDEVGTNVTQPGESDIAVIGLAGRFPGARDVDKFWDLLRTGTEAISFFSAQELLDEGIPADVVGDPRYVPAKGVLDDPDLFDAAFFGYSPRDAAAIDPQQRLFLECAWQALENAGVDPGTTKSSIGVYAGCSASTYLVRPLRELANAPEFMEIVLGNDKDHLPTRTSYKLDLRGPSVCIQSACSTSLVAVHMAVQGLLSGDCDMALAGGASVMFPRREGYTFSEEGIYSHDGHCRAFDARATGTLPGDGVGVVVLKLLTDALRDGDPVHAVIKGTAVNNDGATKVGFSAPSIAGQAEVIRAAHRVAGVDPATIGYIEAHGTGTALGDPAEVAGLTKAFRAGTDRVGYCAIGSVKSNIGHLDVAAGVAGLIKSILALKHRTIPPSLHFERPNPAMDIEGSPFYVSTRAASWPAGDTPRRAGVSSFGIGGTNAHVILEEAAAYARPAVAESHRPSLLLLSARTPAALDRATDDLAAHLLANPDVDPADVAWTTQVGRRGFEHRRFVVCHDTAGAVRLLTDVRRPEAIRRPAVAPPVVFMLPGQGAQHLRMGSGLHRSEPRFRVEFDRCHDVLAAEFDIDLRDVLFSSDAADQVDDTTIAQPALFAVEYALARLWQDWGVKPRALIGHSLGEYVAACLAGVFAVEDALRLVARRGRLMAAAEPGAMLGVALSEQELGGLPAGVSLAAVNAARLCVVSGPETGIEAAERELAGRGVDTRRLRTSRAFHSAAMATAAAELRTLVEAMPVRPPTIPFVSNLTGTWITDEQAVDPRYWAEHTLAPVRFADGLATVLADGPQALLEVGPGHTLSTLARQRVDSPSHDAVVVPSMRHPRSRVPDTEVLEEAIGHLWAVGATIDWDTRHGGRRVRVPLPTYPFERQRYWLAELAGAPSRAPVPTALAADPPHAAPAVAVEFSGPHAAVQRTVAGIWAELLGVARVLPEDDFFALGGHSLLGTRLTTRLREAFEVDVKLRDLFELPTVAAQAELVSVLRRTGRGAPTRPQDHEEGEL